MFVVIYLFEPKVDKVDEFLILWNKMTSTIFENCNSLGSRLHKSSDTKYVAYAQWPDETTFRESKLPNVFEKLRTSFKKSCNKVDVLFELEMVDDLLK